MAKVAVSECNATVFHTVKKPSSDLDDLIKEIACHVYNNGNDPRVSFYVDSLIDRAKMAIAVENRDTGWVNNRFDELLAAEIKKVQANPFSQCTFL